jgi:energy-coupling factor transporter ATP-binding protein EcfA2
VIGSTGAGKSTLVNSLAGRPVTSTGVLRPTTKRAIVWASAANRVGLERLGEVVVDDHPLLDSVALIDTPDLDSDLVDHQAEALAVTNAADAIVFVTSATRYGDALPWSILIREARRKPTAVLLNRVPSRASGARNDLIARLGREGLGSVPVFSIGEQRVDAKRGLAPQSVRRLATALRNISSRAISIRRAGFEDVSNRVADDLIGLADAVEERNRVLGSLDQATEARYEMLAREIADVKPALRSRLRPRRSRERTAARRNTVLEAFDRAAADVAALWSEAGIAMSGSLRRADRAIELALDEAVDKIDLAELIAADRERFASVAPVSGRMVPALLREAAERLRHFEWED